MALAERIRAFPAGPVKITWAAASNIINATLRLQTFLNPAPGPLHGRFQKSMHIVAQSFSTMAVAKLAFADNQTPSSPPLP
jgi:hypothetical protein